MPDVPAQCSQCGTWFPSGIFLKNARNVRLAGFASACPRCGGTGIVPDGLYSATGETLTILASYHPEALRRLQESVNRLRQEAVTDREKVTEALDSVGGQELGRYVPRDANQLAPFIQALAIILSALIAWHAVSRTAPDPDQIADQVFERIAESIPGESTADRTTDKIPRNAPCPCGSGTKYKKCCLLERP